jgi:hypothetical protein
MSRKSGSQGAKLKQLEAVLNSSGTIEYIGDLSDDQRMAGIKVFAEGFKHFVQQNPLLKRGLKELKGRSHTRRSHSQRGGGFFDSEFAEEIRDTEAQNRKLRDEINADPDNLVNPQKVILIRDNREYIKEMKKWRQFHNYVYVLSVPLLAPQFARMLMAVMIHVIAFSASTVPGAGAGLWNGLVAFIGHLFSPINRLTRTVFHGEAQLETEQPDDNTGLCRPGYRPDPSLGCVQIFTPKAAAADAPWALDVTHIMTSTIDAVKFNLQQTVAEPLHGIATVAVGCAMLWRLHQLIQYEENQFREKLERLRAAQRQAVQAMTTLEQNARTAQTAALATLGPAFAQIGNGHALQMIANGIFRTTAPAQQQLLLGATAAPQSIPRAIARIANAPRVGSHHGEAAALEGLLALSAGPTRRVRRGSTAGP